MGRVIDLADLVSFIRSICGSIVFRLTTHSVDFRPTELLHHPGGGLSELEAAGRHRGWGQTQRLHRGCRPQRGHPERHPKPPHQSPVISSGLD